MFGGPEGRKPWRGVASMRRLSVAGGGRFLGEDAPEDVEAPPMLLGDTSGAPLLSIIPGFFQFKRQTRGGGTLGVPVSSAAPSDGV